MRSAVSHPIFARFYARIAAGAESAGASDHRREVLSVLAGRVIEVGAGSGLNFPYYPPEVTEVVAVEPEPHLRRKAVEAATRAAVPVTIVDGHADQLPADTEGFDAGVASLMLCSVPDQRGALAEFHRVIRSGGELRFYEHIRAEDPGWAAFQDRADRVWPFFGGGCHPNRDTPAAIEAAGFTIAEQRRFLFQPCVVARPVAPHVIGRATRT